MTTPFHNTIRTHDNASMAIKWTPNLEKEENKKLQDDFINNFSKKIKQVRQELGLTQRQVAERAGLHEAYYGHVEIKRFKPSLFVAWKISKALDKSLTDLTDL